MTAREDSKGSPTQPDRVDVNADALPLEEAVGLLVEQRLEKVQVPGTKRHHCMLVDVDPSLRPMLLEKARRAVKIGRLKSYVEEREIANTASGGTVKVHVVYVDTAQFMAWAGTPGASDSAAHARAERQRNLEPRNARLVKAWQGKMKKGNLSQTAACYAVARELLHNDKSWRIVERAVKPKGLWV